MKNVIKKVHEVDLYAIQVLGSCLLLKSFHGRINKLLYRCASHEHKNTCIRRCYMRFCTPPRIHWFAFEYCHRLHLPLPSPFHCRSRPTAALFSHPNNTLVTSCVCLCLCARHQMTNEIRLNAFCNPRAHQSHSSIGPLIKASFYRGNCSSHHTCKMYCVYSLVRLDKRTM